MKQVIDGKLYNTNTATLIASGAYGYPSDFNRWKADLYVTKNGRYFLAGEGGPMTRWATRHSDGSRSDGSGIQVLSKEEALAFCESRHCDADVDTIQKFFPIIEA